MLKKPITRALRYETTWMSDAEQAVHVLDIYGEGWSNPSPEVIEKVAHRTGQHEVPCGFWHIVRLLAEMGEGA